MVFLCQKEYVALTKGLMSLVHSRRRTPSLHTSCRQYTLSRSTQGQHSDGDYTIRQRLALLTDLTTNPRPVSPLASSLVALCTHSNGRALLRSQSCNFNLSPQAVWMSAAAECPSTKLFEVSFPASFMDFLGGLATTAPPLQPLSCVLDDLQRNTWSFFFRIKSIKTGLSPTVLVRQLCRNTARHPSRTCFSIVFCVV